jgi:hypothetical protein
MGNLSDALTKSFFTAGKWEVALVLSDTEVVKKGYQREVPKWTVNGSQGDAQVVFAFSQYTKFDEVAVYRDGLLVTSSPILDENGKRCVAAYPPGADMVHSLSVSLSEDG